MFSQMQALTGRSNRELWWNAGLLTLDSLLSLAPYLLLYLVIEGMFQPSPEISQLWMYCALMVLTLFIRMVITQKNLIKTSRFSTQAGLAMRENLADKLKRIPMGELLNLEQGKINNTLLKDVHLTEQVFSQLFSQIVGTVILVAMVTFGLMIVDWRLALAMVSGLPIAIVIFIMLKDVGTKMKAQLFHISDKVNSALFEYIQGIKVLRSFHQAGEQYLNLNTKFKTLRDVSIKFEFAFGMAPIAFIVLVEAGFAVFLMVAVYLLLGGQLAVPTLLLFLIVSTRFYKPLTQLAMFIAQLQYFQSAMDRIENILNLPELLHAEKCGEETVTDVPIVFNGVTFSYQQQTVLGDVSFKCRANTITALVGPSGAGKTTITNLIARFWDVTQGEVFVSGRNVKSLSQAELAKQISVVFQDVYLFDDTIYNNLTLGSHGVSYDRVKLVCEQTRCWSFIRQLPEGLETRIGEGGARLSGGEKQRLSIARAILKEAPIVLLDEATASLDPENEKEVQLAINELVKNKTVIVIAHKLSTVVNADQIIVLDYGQVEAIGPHQVLIGSHRLTNGYGMTKAKIGGGCCDNRLAAFKENHITTVSLIIIIICINLAVGKQIFTE